MQIELLIYNGLKQFVAGFFTGLNVYKITINSLPLNPKNEQVDEPTSCSTLKW